MRYRGPSKLGYTIYAVVATAVAVATIVSRPLGPLSSILGLGPLVWLGRRSYGVYLFHYPIFVAVHANGGSHADQLLGVGLSIVVAALSYQVVESPALRFKKSFSEDRSPPSPT